MMKQTNKPVVDATSLKFAAFLQEGLNCVDAYTPTLINSGGCGIFAYLLADKLDKFNIKYKIFALFDKSEKISKTLSSNLKKYQKGIKKLDSKSFAVSHVVLFIEDELYVDSDGIMNEIVLNEYSELEIDKKTLRKLNKLKVWNEVFDRTTAKEINEKLDEVFSKIYTFHSGIFKFPKKKSIKLTDYTLKHRKRRSKMKMLANLLDH